MFTELSLINHRPEPFEFYTTPLLWNDPYVSSQMLRLHLNETVDLASRNKQFIQKSSAWILDHFGTSSSSKICDFGCGPGLYTTAFAKHGARVTGIDLSESSIRFAQQEAKRQNLPIRYLLQNYLEYAPKERFDLITMIFCDFSVLSPQQRRTLLRTFHDSLEDDGAVLFDLYSIEHFNSTSEKRAYEYVESNGFWSKDPYYAFTNTFKYEKEKLILDKHTVIDEHKTKEIYNWFQCFSIPAIESELHACGLHITEAYSDVAGSPYRTGSNEIALVVRQF
jgi:cyclopropane fatty-acyl-phospholipid synthase-like methyltransferase